MISLDILCLTGTNNICLNFAFAAPVKGKELFDWNKENSKWTFYSI